MKYQLSLKLVLNIFLGLFLMVTVGSTTPAKSNNTNESYSDTIYATSTFQLKSEKIPDSVFMMKDLRHLSINGMDCDHGDKTNCWVIKEIPAEIKKLKNLKTIRLTLNAFSSVPKELTELPNLILLDLTDNGGLTNVDNLTKIQSLQYLYLYGCGLKELPKNIWDLRNLKEFGLAGNNLNKNEQVRIKKALPNCIIKF